MEKKSCFLFNIMAYQDKEVYVLAFGYLFPCNLLKVGWKEANERKGASFKKVVTKLNVY